MKQNKYIFNFICISLFILFFILVYSKFKTAEKRLLDNNSMTYGQIMRIECLKGESLDVVYSFYVKNKLNTNKTYLSVHSKNKLLVEKILVNKLLPILYEKNNPENSIILLSKKHFEDYKIQRADSLNSIYSKLDSLIELR